jgi:hypothetical protein
MVFNDNGVGGEQIVFDDGLYVSNGDATLVLVFDCESLISIKGGCVGVGRFGSSLVRNMITLDMEGRSVAETCVQRRAT